MSMKLRKTIGIFLIVALIFLYAILATTIASAKLAQSAWYIHLLYFFVSGFFWIVPAMFIIKWMMKPEKA